MAGEASRRNATALERNGETSPSFGTRLKRLREAAGLTQEELANRAGLTAKAIGALERGERKRPYPHTVRSLADALGLEKDERAFLLEAVPRGRGGTPERAEEVSPTREEGSSAPIPPTALPAPPTPLVGRERELEEVGIFLGRPETRLLTLTGTGGVGKTRLAQEAARESAELFPDGTVFVALAPLNDAGLVLPTIVRSLGLVEAEVRMPHEVLCAFLGEKRFLLVLDNFEHVLEAAPEVAALVEFCPNLTVLVTSRAPLRVRGEQEYPVPPLALPSSTRSPEVEQVEGAASSRLFVERARAASPVFELTRENAGAVAAICWRLDGLPLALELAAAKARFLDPASLLGRLDRALSAGWARDLPERQRTMRATLSWSHDLLSETEKALFGHLSVFAGGFTLEAAEEVGASEGVEAEEVLELLGRLAEQSLVMAEASKGGTRYRMLEPVRQYALERLEESGDAEETRRRHAGYYLALAERAGPELRGPKQVTWLERLEAEIDNLRAALRWSVERGEGEKIARTAWSSWTYWWLSGHVEEGHRWMEETLDGVDLSESDRAKLLFVASTLGMSRGDWQAARRMVEESLRLFRRLGDEVGAAYALGTAGLVALGQERYEEGAAILEEAVALCLEVGEKWGASLLSGYSAAVPLMRGDFARARQLAEKGLSLAREIGAREGVSTALHTLATIARTEGDHERAERLFEEGLKFSAEVGEGTDISYYLEGLAAIAAESEDRALLVRAARLWGAAEATREKSELVFQAHAPDRALYRRQVNAARERLEGETWTRAWNEGRAMDLEEAVEYALGGDG